MANVSVSFSYTTGKTTLYVFPDGLSLATWATNRVALTESAIPNTGRYTATLSDGYLWWIFDSSSQPSSFASAIGYFDLRSLIVNVTPITSQPVERVNDTTINVYKDESTPITVSTTATLDTLTLRFCVEDNYGKDALTIENASITRSGGSFTVTIPSSLTSAITSYQWTLRDITTGNTVLAKGVLAVQAAASKDA